MGGPSGFVLVNKPAGWTSRRVVDVVAARYPSTKVGHCGTLDPLAEGLLVVAVGSARRLTDLVHEQPKTYEATFRLGFVSDSDDAESELRPAGDPSGLSEESIREVLGRFVGEILQRPPDFSAVRVGGQRAHRLARRGRSVNLAPRPVQIYELQLLRWSPPDLEVRIVCGKGTYIRSLARDVGNELGCGGVLLKLRRTAIGPFRLEKACTIQEVEQLPSVPLHPPKLAVSHLPQVTLPARDIDRLRHGQRLSVPSLQVDGSRVAVMAPDGSLAAVCEYDAEKRTLQPRIVLA